MHSHLTKTLAKKIAQDRGLTLSQVEDVFNAYPDFLFYVFTEKCNPKEKYYPTVRVNGWGVFHCPIVYKEEVKRRKELRDGKVE